MMEEISFTRYLAAKKTVDDRSLNQRVWDSLVEALPHQSPQHPLHILEVGCGIGTMVERMAEKRLIRFGEYTGVDFQAENLEKAVERLHEWAVKTGIRWSGMADGRFRLSNEFLDLSIAFIHADVSDFINLDERAATWDLLIANAFLDLVDLDSTLHRLMRCLRPGGLYYFTLNFDGLTSLEPGIDPELDEQIMRLYHRTMDLRQIKGEASGDSRTGRRLFAALKKAGAEVLEAGASDWVVYPRKGLYPYDEANFLHFIIQTIGVALNGNPELDEARFEDWIAERHTQVQRGELVYIAHQIDFLGST